jgi:hypothetical protein
MQLAALSAAHPKPRFHVFNSTRFRTSLSLGMKYDRFAVDVCARGTENKGGYLKEPVFGAKPGNPAIFCIEFARQSIGNVS